MEQLPSHIPIQIEKVDIPKLKTYLIEIGFENTFFQVVKPKQVFGMVKEIKYNSITVDHHIRCYSNGVITTEIEPHRLKNMWAHLSTRSMSAHEYVISYLLTFKISYIIDEEQRIHYNNLHSGDFKKDYTEFFRWLFVGVIFWSPLGYIWKFFDYIGSIKYQPLHLKPVDDGTFSD